MPAADGADAGDDAGPVVVTPGCSQAYAARGGRWITPHRGAATMAAADPQLEHDHFDHALLD